MITEKGYDAIYNEGDEGFNPVRAARDDREAAEERALPVNREERLCDISNEINRLGSSPEGDEKREALWAEASEIKAEIATEFAAKWTAEITAERRAAWNKKVSSGEIKTAADVARARRDLGWSITDLADLKKAVAIHAS